MPSFVVEDKTIQVTFIGEEGKSYCINWTELLTPSEVPVTWDELAPGIEVLAPYYTKNGSVSHSPAVILSCEDKLTYEGKGKGNSTGKLTKQQYCVCVCECVCVCACVCVCVCVHQQQHPMELELCGNVVMVDINPQLIG